MLSQPASSPPSHARVAHKRATRSVPASLGPWWPSFALARSSPFGAIRAAVDSLGFALQAFARPARQVVDQAHHAIYFVSSDLVLGYVIIVPGRRPVAVYGPVSPDSLRARVLAYLRINRELETGGP